MFLSLPFSLTWGPIWANFQNILQTSPEFSSQWTLQKYCFGFLTFQVSDFPWFVFPFSLAWDPMGANFQKYCFGFLTFWFSDFSWFLLRFCLIRKPMGAKMLNRFYFFFKFLLNFLLTGPLKSNVLNFRKFWVSDFSGFVSGNFTSTIVAYTKTRNCIYVEKQPR